nr:9219_t:CDS:2 [Entrophospora candida]
MASQTQDINTNEKVVKEDVKDDKDDNNDSSPLNSEKNNLTSTSISKNDKEKSSSLSEQDSSTKPFQYNFGNLGSLAGSNEKGNSMKIFGSGTSFGFTATKPLGFASYASSSTQKVSDSTDETTDDNSEKIENKYTTSITLKPQEVLTGEENEETVYSTRAKLYKMDKDMKWCERGIGILKINIPLDTTTGSCPRLIMRTESTLVVILNLAIFSDMMVHRKEDKFIQVGGFENGTPVNYLVKVGSEAVSMALYDSILDVIKNL